MPRDGTQTYILPFPNVEEDTTIESAVYNGFTNDVAQDLNTARPISSGGTGATSADAALVALSGEKANQIVTNYDSHVWLSGSFSADGSATGGPVGGHAFSGVVYVTDASNIVVEARDVTDNKLYIRRKAAGTWGAWVDAAAADDARFVNVAGDTMTGDLVIAKTDPYFVLRAAAAGQTCTLQGEKAGLARWGVTLGNAEAESGGNVGSRFAINRYDDAGVYLNSPFQINRATGNADFLGALTANGFRSFTSVVADTSVYSGYASANTGTYFFGSNGTKFLNCDGTNFSFVGAPLIVHSTMYSANSATVGTYCFGTSGVKYLQYDGTNFNFVGGMLTVPSLATGGGVTAASFFCGSSIYGSTSIELGAQGAGPQAAFIDFHTTGGTPDYDARIICNAGTTSLSFNGASFSFGGWIEFSGFRARQGMSGGFGASYHNFYYAGPGAVQVWVDVTNVGNISLISDYRIKKDVIDLPGMWDTVKALRPIKYTQADFTPPAQLEHNAKQRAEGKEVSNGPMVEADNVERWGFIAHELQETLVPSAATGEKDSPDHIQSPNPFTVIAALTKALQEAMLRIEALEAR